MASAPGTEVRPAATAIVSAVGTTPFSASLIIVSLSIRALRILYQMMRMIRMSGVAKINATIMKTSPASQGASSTKLSNESYSLSLPKPSIRTCLPPLSMWRPLGLTVTFTSSSSLGALPAGSAGEGDDFVDFASPPGEAAFGVAGAGGAALVSAVGAGLDLSLGGAAGGRFSAGAAFSGVVAWATTTVGSAPRASGTGACQTSIAATNAAVKTPARKTIRQSGFANCLMRTPIVSCACWMREPRPSDSLQCNVRGNCNSGPPLFQGPTTPRRRGEYPMLSSTTMFDRRRLATFLADG